jgi:hypothetical protein
MNIVKRKIKTFAALGFSTYLILPFMLITLGIMRIVILTMPFRLITKIFLKPKPHKAPYKNNKIQLSQAIGKSASIIAKYTPWQSKCLVQGLAVRTFLRFFRIPSVFYIGVMYDNNNSFLSHAWISSYNTTIVGGDSSFEQFKVIKQFEDK